MGIRRYEQYVNTKIGELFIKAIKRDKHPSVTRIHPKFLCICRCGKEVWLDAQRVVSYKTQSCGCWQLQSAHDKAKKEPNEITQRGNIIYMKLPHNKECMLDATDYYLVKDYFWNSNSHNYVKTRPKNHGKTLWMHRIIMQPKDNEVVDHIDHNPLNNCRANLRICNQLQNTQNHKINRNNTSGYKGVCYDKHHKTRPWLAQICKNRHHYHIGNFNTPEEAAHAYDQKAKELFGEFATLNFPEEV